MMKRFRFFFHERSLWYKFTLLSVIPVILATFFIVLNIVTSVQQSMITETSIRALELTRLSALSASHASVVYNKQLLDNLVDNLGKEKDVLWAMIWDLSDGRILSHSDHEMDGRLLAEASAVVSKSRSSFQPAAETASRDAQIRKSTAPIVISGKKYGEVRVAFSFADVHQKIFKIKKQIIIIAAMAIVLGGILAAFLSRILSKPIRALAAQAHDIGAGNYEKAILYDSRDALGRLVIAINKMVSDIQNRQEQLEAEISERRRAEEFTRRYDFIVNASKDWNTLINRHYVYEAVNEAYCLSLDMKQEKIVGRTVSDVWGETVFHEIIKGNLERCFKGEEINYQAWFETPAGAYQYFNVTYYPYKGRDDQVSHAVVVSHNITDLKRTEDVLQQSVREMTALNTLGQRFGASLSLDQVVKTALEETISPVGAEVAMIYLRENDRLLLQGFRSLKPGFNMNLKSRHKLGECLCGRAAEDGAPVYTTDFQRDPRCTDGECKQAGLRSVASLPLNGRGGVVGVLGFGSQTDHDFEKQAIFLEALAGEVAMALENALLYEQVQRQASDLQRRVAERTAELEKAMEKAKESDQLKSAFLASMSHELRTPLNSIIGFTGIMLQGLVGVLNPEQTKQLGMVQNSAHHLLSLINDVLDISKIEAGQLEIETEPFDMRDAIFKVIRTITPIAEKKGLPLEIEIAPEIGTIVSDRRRVEQILINLINNAVKFTEKGSIHITCRIDNRELETQIVDTGIGVKPEDMDWLFKAFHQIDSGLTRRYDGTGLGLSICKKLVELLGGGIWVESQWGEGSVFAFRLPL